MIHTLEEKNAKTMQIMTHNKNNNDKISSYLHPMMMTTSSLSCYQNNVMIPSSSIIQSQQHQQQQYQVYPYYIHPTNEMIMATMQQQQQQHQHQGGHHVPYPHLGQGSSSSAKVSSISPTTTTAVTGQQLLHPNPLTDPYSPYRQSHEVLLLSTNNNNATSLSICITKKNDGNDKFGITLHYECRSALVPREIAKDVLMIANEDTNKTIPPPSHQQPPRRERMNYGVVSIIDASKARYINSTTTTAAAATTTTTTGASILEPGDIILTINGQSVGGMIFSNAIRLMLLSESYSTVCGLDATTSTTTSDDIICCYLTVARQRRRSLNANNNVMQQSSSTTPTVKSLPPSSRAAVVVGGVPTNTNPTMIKIPFVVNGNGTIHGQFSKIEWRALIHGLSTVPHRLFSNMALVTVSQREVLVEILQCSSNELHCRDIKALETKLEYESNCLLLNMKELAKKYWTMKWKSEVEAVATNNVDNDDNSATIIMNNKKDMSMLTDAQRSVLRGAVRPTNGECKCGSTSHTFVSDSKCPLYRDVILYCKDNSINIRGSSSSSTTSQQYYNRGGNVKVNTNNVLEKAYVDRYIKLRNEDSAIRDEAIFVLEMETIQSSIMHKAVLAPSSLCTLLLSAVASIQDQDELLDGGGMNSTSNIVDMTMNRTSSKMGRQAAVPESNSDDSDDEDLPLNALVQTKQSGSKHKAMTTTNNSSSPSKRPKCDTEHHAKTRSSNNLPHSYFMAKILKHISRCHGHVFTEPSHADYAWQQRHRSTITTPLSKEVMFMGNPRTPGSHSFENIHFILDDERMSRLRIAWEQQHVHNNKHDHDHDDDNINDMTEINDEWIITHLVSDTVTGLRHELNVLVSMGILYIDTSGKIVLARNWEEHVPHMILNEMKYVWGTKVDVNNLFCIHDTIKTSLRLYWKSNEYGWQRRRLAISNNKNVDDNNNTIVDYENVFDDEEYQLREQIFRENYTNYLSASLGMGEFGV
jgi:hypothetical protein